MKMSKLRKIHLNRDYNFKELTIILTRFEKMIETGQQLSFNLKGSTMKLSLSENKENIITPQFLEHVLEQIHNTSNEKKGVIFTPPDIVNAMVNYTLEQKILHDLFNLNQDFQINDPPLKFIYQIKKWSKLNSENSDFNLFQIGRCFGSLMPFITLHHILLTNLPNLKLVPKQSRRFLFTLRPRTLSS